MDIGKIIMSKRKSLGLTQQALAKEVNVSSQAVSKWENGTSCPEIDLLPIIAKTLGASVDSLLGYEAVINADYENRYQKDDYYWGVVPNQLCYEIKATGQTIKSIGYRMRRGKRCSFSGKKWVFCVGI